MQDLYKVDTSNGKVWKSDDDDDNDE